MNDTLESGKSSFRRPFTRSQAKFPAKHLIFSEDAAQHKLIPERGILQNGSEQIPNLSACSSLAIMQVESSDEDENPDCLPTCSELENDTEVKDKINDTSGIHGCISHHKSHSSGYSEVHSTVLQLTEEQCQSSSSRCENDSPHETGLSGMNPDTTILQTIYSKYGDITKGCDFKSDTFKKSCLLAICSVIHKLENTNVDDMNADDFMELFSLTKDAENLNIDVKWLHQHLVDVQESIRSRDKLNKMEEAQRSITLQEEILQKRIQTNKLEITKIEHEIEMLKDEQARKKSRHDEVKALTEDIESSYHSFPKFLIDWLL
ncbi:hypothetical protein RND81_08G115800 [Saponaria officinalis]|uniref:Phospholipase-like protein n=1 Tax=Saponaria officinalis TaxID=3572 RepID=A0AAW1J6X1_SAPOF